MSLIVIVVLVIALLAVVVLGLHQRSLKQVTPQAAEMDLEPLPEDQATVPVEVVPADATIYVGVNERLRRKVLLHLKLEPGEKVLRMTRLHWVMLVPSIFVTTFVLFLLLVLLINPARTVGFNWPPQFLTDAGQELVNPTPTPSPRRESKKQEGEKTRASERAERRKERREAREKEAARQKKAAAETDRVEFDITARHVFLAVLLGFLLWATKKDNDLFSRKRRKDNDERSLKLYNPLTWYWTVWVITSLKVRKLVVMPSLLPGDVDKDPLYISEVKGAAVHTTWLDRRLRTGWVKLKSKVENSSLPGEPTDPIGPLLDPDGFAEDAEAASRAYEESLRRV